MKSKLLISLLLIAGAAHADWDDPIAPFDASNIPATPLSITWVTTDNVQKVCDAESRRRGKGGFGYSIQACSFWEGNSCTIVTSKRPSMHTVGHETRHCFQGNWH